MMRCPPAFLTALVGAMALTGGAGIPLSAGETIPVQRTIIDEGVSWVTPHWGWHASKLIYDGDHFYTIGHWGVTQPTSRGVIYRLDGDEWMSGYTWDDLNYQPGQILLDNGNRLVIVYGRRGDRPGIKRATQPGDFNTFESLEVPEWLSPAGYVGGSIHDDVLILGYIGSPKVYSFNIAMLDLTTEEWKGPFLLAEGQREEVPFTTWRYPIIHPEDDGFHLVVTSGKDGVSPRRHEFYYVFLDYDIQLPIRAEVVDGVDPVDGHILVCDATAMHRAPDGGIYITGQYTTTSRQYQLCVWYRAPGSSDWNRSSLSTNDVQVNGAFIHRPDDPEALWLLATSGTPSRFQIHLLMDNANTWEEWDIEPLDDHDPGHVYSLHIVQAISGSTIPQRPVAIFPSREPKLEDESLGWRTWFAEITLPGESGSESNADTLQLK